ncbi:MAG: ABC transporter substrate-binding protein [Reinekea sp.]|jgi:two-component system, oxyanion-binding sensor
MLTMENADNNIIKIGYVPLLDCAPLIVAQEAGFFQKQGLDVDLVREHNWASIRDKLSLGLIDAAHILAPMVIASAALTTKPFRTALSLGYNGNAITVSKAIYDHIQSDTLDASISKLGDYINTQSRPLVLGTVFPHSMHTYLLNLLLKNAGVSKEQVIIRVIPPVHMVNEMHDGKVDIFCVGEPWNSHAQFENAGHILCYGNELWPYAPEKVLATHPGYAQKQADQYRRLSKAIIQACEWLEQPDHSAQTALWMADEMYLNCSSDLLLQAITNQWYSQTRPGNSRKIFFDQFANAPWPEHAQWLVNTMKTLEQIPQDANIQSIYDWETYLSVLKEMGLPTPGMADMPKGLPDL